MGSEKNNGFKYAYYAPTEAERQEVESIRRDYTAKDDTSTRLDKLRRMDKIIKKTPKATAIIVGVIGLLIFGLGMAVALEWQYLGWGIAISTLGGVVMAVACPIKAAMQYHYKCKYLVDILTITDEILGQK